MTFKVRVHYYPAMLSTDRCGHVLPVTHHVVIYPPRTTDETDFSLCVWFYKGAQKVDRWVMPRSIDIAEIRRRLLRYNPDIFIVDPPL